MIVVLDMDCSLYPINLLARFYDSSFYDSMGTKRFCIDPVPLRHCPGGGLRHIFERQFRGEIVISSSIRISAADPAPAPQEPIIPPFTPEQPVPGPIAPSPGPGPEIPPVRGPHPEIPPDTAPGPEIPGQPADPAPDIRPPLEPVPDMPSPTA